MLTPTVLVLGAGASKPYGLPIGTELVSQIAESIASGRSISSGTQAAQMWSDPHAREFIRDQMLELADRIRRSRTPTIDAFLETCHASDRAIIVRAMVDALWRQEHEAVISTEPREGDWLGWLYHHRLYKNPTEFQCNQLVIVNFNYDRLPQLLLATMMRNKYRNCSGRSWQLVNEDVPTDSGTILRRYHHVHGAICRDPVDDARERVVDCGYHTDLVESACKNIVTMGGNADDPDSRLKRHTDIAYFEQLWSWSNRVFLLGVGYHQENLEKIGLARATIDGLHERGKLIGGTAFGLDAFDRARVERLVGTGFRLGRPDQDCLSFVREHLSPDE